MKLELSGWAIAAIILVLVVGGVIWYFGGIKLALGWLLGSGGAYGAARKKIKNRQEKRKQKIAEIEKKAEEDKNEGKNMSDSDIANDINSRLDKRNKRNKRNKPND